MLAMISLAHLKELNIVNQEDNENCYRQVD